MSTFGWLSRLEFLQNAASWAVAAVNPAMVHNIEKYIALKKVLYLSAIEAIEGDYLEFGVFTGSSFCHSIRCAQKLSHFGSIANMRFFGFDSFAGFGDVKDEDKHPFYTDKNFKTNPEQVRQRIRRIAKAAEWKLIPGFFNESLKPGAMHYGLTRCRVLFIDCDTYSGAQQAFTFCNPIVQEGTILVLDDFFAYRGHSHKGVSRAFAEFLEDTKFAARHIMSYGMGGSVFILSHREK